MDSQEIAALIKYGKSIAPASAYELHGIMFEKGDKVRFKDGTISHGIGRPPVDLTGKTGVVEMWHHENVNEHTGDIMYHVQYGPDAMIDGICISGDNLETAEK